MKIDIETGGATSELQRQYLSTVLNAKDSAIDIYMIDIVNPAQYFGAGWLEPLDAYIGAPATVPTSAILVLQSIASVTVALMITVMTYSVAFQGVLLPERLIKQDFVRWWLYGPFVGIMSQGTSGDLMWMNYGAAKSDQTLDGYADAVAKLSDKGGDLVGDAVVDAHRDAVTSARRHQVGGLGHDAGACSFAL